MLLETLEIEKGNLEEEGATEEEPYKSHIHHYHILGLPMKCAERELKEQQYKD